MPTRIQGLRSIAGISALTLAITAASTACAQSPSFPDAWFYSGVQRPAALKSLEGKPAKALSVESWIGEEITLAEHRGKVIIIDFWATWCGPCIAAIPENIELVDKYKNDGLVFVGVHDSNSGWDSASKVVRDKGINYPVAKDKAGGPTTKAYNLQFWPTYIAIDRMGVIRAAGLTPGHLDDAIKTLLAESGPSDLEIAKGFGPEYFYGAANRPVTLRNLEGKPAPELAGDRWLESSLDDANWRNSVVVLHFTSTSTTIGRKQLSELAAVEKEFASQGVTFVAVNNASANEEQARQSLADAQLDIPLLFDTPESANAKAYGVRFLPTTIVIGRSGDVRAAGVRLDKLGAALERLLAEPAP